MRFTRWFRFPKPFSILRISFSNSGVSLLLAAENAAMLPLFPSLTLLPLLADCLGYLKAFDQSVKFG